jgi:hypothetical protein
VLTLCDQKADKPEIDKITSALKQYEANEATLAKQSIKEEDNSGELALYSAKGKGSGVRGRGKVTNEIDWGNTKNGDGVCWHCGKSGHIAQYCVADMPENAKQHILDHAQLADIAICAHSEANDDDLFAF